MGRVVCLLLENKIEACMHDGTCNQQLHGRNSDGKDFSVHTGVPEELNKSFEILTTKETLHNMMNTGRGEQDCHYHNRKSKSGSKLVEL